LGIGLVLLVFSGLLTGCSASSQPEPAATQAATPKEGPDRKVATGKSTGSDTAPKEDKGSKSTQADSAKEKETGKKSTREDPPKKGSELLADSFRISPLGLGVLDAEIHKVHREGLGKGCVKVAFTGERYVFLKMEIWEKGQVTQIMPHSPEKSLAAAREYCFSVQRAKAEKEPKETFQLTFDTEDGYTAYNVPAPKFEGKPVYTSVVLTKAIDAKEGTLVPAWLFTITKAGADRPTEPSLVERARRAEWAFLVNVTVKKDKKPIDPTK
jgi:hypothetical protein